VGGERGGGVGAEGGRGPRGGGMGGEEGGWRERRCGLCVGRRGVPLCRRVVGGRRCVGGCVGKGCGSGKGVWAG
jgi:hypothetical protein